MLINIKTPVSLQIDKLTDLPKMRIFMENNNLKADRDIFEFATKENTEQYFKAFEGVQLGKHTGEQYLSMISRTLRELWEQSPIVKHLEMWEVLKRY